MERQGVGRKGRRKSIMRGRTRGGLLVAGTAPALAEGIAAVELAGRTKRATAAKPEALEPGEYDMTGSGEIRCEFSRHCYDSPREGKRMSKPQPEALPPQKCECEGARTGAKLESKGPVGANKLSQQGIVACNKKSLPTTNSARRWHHPYEWPRTLGHTPSVSSYRRGVDLCLS